LEGLGGPIGPVGPIDAVESNGVSTGLYYSNTTGLEGRIDASFGTEFQYSWRALDPPPQSIRIDLWALWINPNGSLIGVL